MTKKDIHILDFAATLPITMFSFSTTAQFGIMQKIY